MSRRKAKWDAGGVKALRRHLGLSQQGMAQELGTRQQTISEWETGLYQPRGLSERLLSLVAERAGFDYDAQPADGSSGSARGAGMTALALAEIYAPGSAWLRLGEAPRDPLSEAELAAIWSGQRFPAEALATVDGRSVEVVYPGRLNGSAGPDFRDAVLLIDGRERRGDVELHVRASSFQAHGHHLDAAYDGLILHLVYLADDGLQTRLHNGRGVDVAALAPWLQRRSAGIQTLLAEPPLWQEPCRDMAPLLGRNAVEEALLLAGRRRFADRVATLATDARALGAEAAFWRAAFESLGAGGDRAGFSRLALLFTPPLARSLRGRRTLPSARPDLEAALLYLAGLAAAPDVRVALPAPLATPLPASGRPANRPERRLLAFVQLYLRANGDLPAYALETIVTASKLKDLLPRWQVAAMRGPALLGAGRAQELLLNVVLPFAAAEPGLAGKVDGLLSQMRPAPAYGRTSFLEANLQGPEGRRPVSSVLAQQGLLAFIEEWCSRGGCGRCPLSSPG